MLVKYENRVINLSSYRMFLYNIESAPGGEKESILRMYKDSGGNENKSEFHILKGAEANAVWSMIHHACELEWIPDSPHVVVPSFTPSIRPMR